MNEIGFRKWLLENGKKGKVASDTISRLKKVERELGNIDMDEEYKKDQCCRVLKLFDNTGRNDEMDKYITTLPIGKYYLSTYRYAVKLYTLYKASIK